MSSLASLFVEVSLIDNVTKGIGAVGQSLTRFGRSATAFVTLPLIGVIKTFGDFEQAMANVNSVTDLTQAEFQEVSRLARQIGKDTIFSGTEAANAIGELARAGVSVTDILAGAARAAVDLAAAAGMQIPEAATIMANAMNVFRIGGENAAHIADVFASAANKSAATVSDLGLALSQSGNVAAQFGISLEDTVATLALFADYGLRGSDAGTSLRTMLLALLDPTDKQAKLMNELNLSFFDANGQFIGLAGMAQELQSKLSGLTEEQRNTALAVLFGTDAVRAASILYAAGPGVINEYVAAVNQQGAAHEMARVRTQTFYGALERMRGSLQEAFIVIGTEMTPSLLAMASAVEQSADAFSAMPAPLQHIAASFALIALVVGPVALVIGFIASNLLSFGAALGVVIVPLTLASNLLTMFGGVAGAIILPIQLVRSNVLGLGDAFDWLVGKISNLLSAGRSALQTLLGVAATVFVAIRTVGVAAIIGLKDGALKGIGDLYLGAVAWFTTIKAAVIVILTRLASEAFNAMFSAGYAIGQGLIAGIAAIWDSVVGYAGALANAVYDKIKGALDIFSPSGKGEYLGRMLGQGLARGIQNSERMVTGAAGGLAGAALSGMATYNGGINISVSGAGDPNAVADRVFSRFVREMGLREGS